MADHVAGAVMSLREVAKGREDVVWHVAHVVVDPPDPLGIRHRVPDEGCCRRTNERWPASRYSVGVRKWSMPVPLLASVMES